MFIILASCFEIIGSCIVMFLITDNGNCKIIFQANKLIVRTVFMSRACMATMGILYYRLAQRSLSVSITEDEPQQVLCLISLGHGLCDGVFVEYQFLVFYAAHSSPMNFWRLSKHYNATVCGLSVDYRICLKNQLLLKSFLTKISLQFPLSWITDIYLPLKCKFCCMLMAHFLDGL